jgi:hypothetical protein
MANNDNALEGFEDLLVRQEIWGGMSVSKLEVLNEFGAIYHSRGRTDEAIAALTEVWEERKGEFGEDDLLALKAHNVLASIYSTQGKVKLAEEMYTKSLSKRMTIDPPHPETLIAANNLGLI